MATEDESARRNERMGSTDSEMDSPPPANGTRLAAPWPCSHVCAWQDILMNKTWYVTGLLNDWHEYPVSSFWEGKTEILKMKIGRLCAHHVSSNGDALCLLVSPVLMEYRVEKRGSLIPSQQSEDHLAATMSCSQVHHPPWVLHRAPC